MVRNLVGPPVTGDDFIGRRQELEEAWKAIVDTNSLLLASPRRVGKSSFAKKLVEKAKDEGWVALYLDVQGIKDETQFAAILLRELELLKENRSLLEKTKVIVDKWISSIKKVEVFGVEFEKSPDSFYTQLSSAFALDKRTLIVVDELVLFLQRLSKDGSTERAETFMNWLRSVRQREVNNISWVFCSSISIHNFVSQNKLSYTVNDVASFHLGEMNPGEAMLLLGQLNESYGNILNQVQMEYILRQIEWKLPFFIQLFFKSYFAGEEIYKSLNIEEAVDKIFGEISVDHQLFTWSERLSGYGKDEKVARRLLNYFCLPHHKSERTHLEGLVAEEVAPGEDVRERYATVKLMLESDGYIVQDDKGIHFRSPIIREFWYNKYVR